MLYMLTDGLLAAAILLAASTFGMWLVPAFLPRQSLGLRWHLLLGAGLGIGFLCLLTLVLGVAGWFTTPICRGLIIVLGAAGLWRLLLLLVRRQPSLMPEDRTYDHQPVGGKFHSAYFLLLVIMPFLALWLLVATVPPGVLWAEEGFGYDVLEYHLQVPKEYYLNGGITYLPHNIYSNFPMNAEMLYLLVMTLRGDPIEAAVLAKFLNALLGVLFVIAAWLIGREYHPLAGVVCALVAGSSPWLMYLSGVAYVENGMLFFGALSLACICLVDREGHSGSAPWRLVMLAGLFAGLSCGFKYTAVAMIAIPLFLALGVLSVSPHGPKPAARKRARIVSQPLLFLLGAAIAFSPWLIKNTVMTGNPVFPLAHDLFGTSDGLWTDDLAEQWQRGHRVEPDDAPVQARLSRFKERVLADRRLGWGLILLALPILFSKRRSPLDVALFTMFVLQAVVWLTFTHLFARFAVPMLIPLCVLAGRSIVSRASPRFRAANLAAVLIVVGLNLHSAASIYAAELIDNNAGVHGHIEWFYRNCDADRTPTGYVRQRLEADSRVLLVGEARAFYMPANVDYCVVFNRNPFADAVAEAESDEDIIRWLNASGYTHLFVFWNEMQRLRRTYGFWSQLTPELFHRLENLGLGVIKDFSGGQRSPYATLYEIRTMPPREPRIMLDAASE